MEETKICPYCGEEILAVAKKCKHCGEWLEAKVIEKEKKACPICGEQIDVDIEICPHCKEPIIEKKDSEEKSVSKDQVSSSDNQAVTRPDDNLAVRNHVNLAFWAVVIGTILSYANTFAQEIPSETDGLIGLFVSLDKLFPSWIGLFLDGIGSVYLLWSVANIIRHQKIAAGQEDNAVSLLLKSLSVLYFATNIIIPFLEEGILAGIGLLLFILMVILIAINGLILKSEKSPKLTGIGYAFIVNTIVFVFILKALKDGCSLEIYMLAACLGDIAWIFAMYAAHSYLLIKK